MEKAVVTKAMLIDRMSEETGFTKKDTKVLLDSIIESISNLLSEGEKVVLANFGTFEVKVASARTARNPRTGEVIEVPAKNKPTFKFSKNIKDVVKQS